MVKKAYDYDQIFYINNETSFDKNARYIPSSESD